MPTRNLIVLAVSLVLAAIAYAARDRNPHGRRLGEVIAAVERSYIEPVDDEALFQAAVDGVMDTLDENSRYVRRDERAEFEASLDLEFGGVGLELSGADTTTSGTEPGSYPRIEGFMPGSPAWRAGLAAGESILAIDGDSTRGMTTSQAIGSLRGPAGSRVVVTVAGPGADAAETAVRDVDLVRETIRIESVLGDRRRDDGGWTWRLEGRPDLAYVRLKSFGEHTRADLETAIKAVVAEDRPAGFVLDLRGNPGGLVSSAVEVADLFLDSREPIVATRGRGAAAATNDGRADVKSNVKSNVKSDVRTAAKIDRRLATDGDLLDGLPMAVLVDDETASAAEIVAAALQDHGRAVVVGGRTYGKGTVQQILPLASDDGLLKLTTSEYLRPSGGSIARRADDNAVPWGVVPNDGLEIAVSGDDRRRIAQWRRSRDAVRTRSAETAATEEAAATRTSVADLPEGIDPVIGRVVEWFTALPAPRMPGRSSPPRR